MPPAVDVYALTHRRDRRAINDFLAGYVDVPQSSDHRGEELLVLRLDAPQGAEVEMDPAALRVRGTGVRDPAA
jgi:hypothetical protein